MNNLIIGDCGVKFTYYETIAGGFGARPTRDGMTNTLNTPAETLETVYPFGSSAAHSARRTAATAATAAALAPNGRSPSSGAPESDGERRDWDDERRDWDGEG